MSDAPTAAYGRFVWFDLMTPDVQAARAFYGPLFEWEIRDVDMGDGARYAMIHAGGQGVGGMETLEGAPPTAARWLGYVEVADVDAAAEAARQGRGSVLAEPTDIPDVGRFCIVQDPTGASLAPFQAASGPLPETEAAAPGHFCWSELLTQDLALCLGWYPRVLPWRVEPLELPAGTYQVVKRGEAASSDAGLMQMPPEAETASHWLHYVRVRDVDAGFRRATELGASPSRPPTDLEGVGRFAVLADPQGAAFALFESA